MGEATAAVAVKAASGHPAKRRAILDAAAEVFLREGYTRSSVDVIAAEAGVSKQTVYNHFGDKENLFTAVAGEVQDEAVVRFSELMDRTEAAASEVSGLGELRELLVSLTTEYVLAVHTGRIVALRKLVDSEAVHHPRIFEQWVANGPRRTMPRLNRLLLDFGRAGLLEVPEDVLDDPERLAGQLTTTPAADVRRGARGESPEREEIERLVRPGVDYFLRAYGRSGTSAG